MVDKYRASELYGKSWSFIPGYMVLGWFAEAYREYRGLLWGMELRVFQTSGYAGGGLSALISNQDRNSSPRLTLGFRV